MLCNKLCHDLCKQDFVDILGTLWMLILTNKWLTKMSSEIQPWNVKPKGKLKWSLKKGKFLAAIIYMLWFIFIHDCNFIYPLLTWQCMIVSLKWNWTIIWTLSIAYLLVTSDFIQLTTENLNCPFIIII